MPQPGIIERIFMKKKKKKLSERFRKSSKISRKEAMKKMGYTAFSAATMFILLNKPEKSQAQPTSEELPPEWEW